MPSPAHTFSVLSLSLAGLASQPLLAEEAQDIADFDRADRPRQRRRPRRPSRSARPPGRE